MNNLKCLLALCALLTAANAFAGNANEIKSFVIYYGSEAKVEKFQPFDLTVIESSNKKIVKALQEKGKTVLAYLSIGEIDKGRDYFNCMKEKGLLLNENPNWPDDFLIDIRNPVWESYIIEKIIPSLTAAGFQGIFIDTLDSSIEQERLNPKKFAGMQKKAVSIIKKIREKFPDLKIMQNRAYEIAPETAPFIDYILGESVYFDYNFKTKKYGNVSKKDYQEQVDLLKKLKQNNPNLIIFTLDYCAENNIKLRQEIYKIQKENGFIPYVTTIELDRITPPPAE